MPEDEEFEARPFSPRMHWDPIYADAKSAEAYSARWFERLAQQISDAVNTDDQAVLEIWRGILRKELITEFPDATTEENLRAMLDPPPRERQP